MNLMRDEAVLHDDDVSAMDATMSACCLRDLEDQRKSQAVRQQLALRDPVRQAEDGRRHALDDEVERHREEDCAIRDAAASEPCVACVLVGTGDESLVQLCKDAVTEWEFADKVFVHHVVNGESCLGGSPPSLLVWMHGASLLRLDKRALERETPRTLLAKLTALSGKASQRPASKTTTTTTTPPACGKPGCDRTFHHVHVQSRYKNAAFDTSDNDDDDDDNESGSHYNSAA